MKTYLKKINFIIGDIYKKKIIFLIVLLFIGMFFEILGLGSLLPVLSLIANPENLKQIPLLNKISYFNELTYNYLVLVLLMGIGALYLIKTLFLSYLTFRQNRFLANISATISNNLFAKYLTQPYEFHINNNSSKLIKNLQTEVTLLGAFNFAVISLFVEAGLLFSILFTLILIEPLGAISVGLFLGVLAYFFYRISRRKLVQWGNEREKADGLITKTTLEGLGGIKDIKLLHVESFFISKFIQNQNLKSRVSSNSNTVAQLPRYYLELISVFGLVLFIISMLYQDKDIPILIATIGVFVAAVFRLMPSLNKILTAFQNIKYYSSSVDIVYSEFLNLQNKSLDQEEKDLEVPKDKIEIQNLSFSYNSDLKPILNEVNLEIKVGETIGIIGASGEGKSTFIDLLNGLYKPTGGKILADNKKIQNNLYSWNKNIGYVAQDIFLIDDTVEQNITFGRDQDNIDYEALNYALKKAQLIDFVEGLAQGLKTKVGERGVQISGGQKQRIGMARALYNDPEILILDEATSSLDTKTEQALMEAIYSLKKKKTIIIVAHRMSTLTKCDRIFEIKNNKLIEQKR
ncbi:ABC transporter ATP-binding protein/permease [Flavobacteriaceae bacterium]|nr:ABC transporter ATP-binding protein/permease [Flavobacteriaceae bacterium]